MYNTQFKHRIFFYCLKFILSFVFLPLYIKCSSNTSELVEVFRDDFSRLKSNKWKVILPFKNKSTSECTKDENRIYEGNNTVIKRNRKNFK